MLWIHAQPLIESLGPMIPSVSEVRIPTPHTTF